MTTDSLSCARCSQRTDDGSLTFLDGPALGDRWRYSRFCPTCLPVMQEAWAQEDMRQRLDKIGVRGIERDMTFARFVPTTDSQAAALEAVKSSSSVWLWGRPGVGKTHLLTAVVIAATLDNGQPTRPRIERATWPALTRNLRSGANARDGASYAEIMGRLQRADLVVIDDLGVGGFTDFTNAALFELVDRRWVEQSAMCITSNEKPSALVAGGLDERTWSRLRGMCLLVHVEGPDRRLEPRGAP